MNKWKNALTNPPEKEGWYVVGFELTCDEIVGLRILYYGMGRYDEMEWKRTDNGQGVDVHSDYYWCEIPEFDGLRREQ